ncbi:MAG: hypothetical protein AAGI91_14760 [Bacteroidota bacterium]
MKISIEYKKIKGSYHESNDCLEVCIPVFFTLDTEELYRLNGYRARPRGETTAGNCEVLPIDKPGAIDTPVILKSMSGDGNPLIFKFSINDPRSHADNTNDNSCDIYIDLAMYINGAEICFEFLLKWWPGNDDVDKCIQVSAIKRKDPHPLMKYSLLFFFLVIMAIWTWNANFNDDVFRGAWTSYLSQGKINAVLLSMMAFFGIKISGTSRSLRSLATILRYPELYVAPEVSDANKALSQRNGGLKYWVFWAVSCLLLGLMFMLHPVSLPESELRGGFLSMPSSSGGPTESPPIKRFQWTMADDLLIYGQDREVPIAEIEWSWRCLGFRSVALTRSDDVLSELGDNDGGPDGLDASGSMPDVESAHTTLDESRGYLGDRVNVQPIAEAHVVADQIHALGESSFAKYSASGRQSAGLRASGHSDLEIANTLLFELSRNQRPIADSLADQVGAILDQYDEKAIYDVVITDFERDGQMPSWERPKAMIKLLAFLKASDVDSLGLREWTERFVIDYVRWTESVPFTSPDSRVIRRTATEVLLFLEHLHHTSMQDRSEATLRIDWHQMASRPLTVSTGAEGTRDYLEQVLHYGLPMTAANRRLEYFTGPTARSHYNSQKSQFWDLIYQCIGEDNVDFSLDPTAHITEEHVRVAFRRIRSVGCGVN